MIIEKSKFLCCSTLHNYMYMYSTVYEQTVFLQFLWTVCGTTSSKCWSLFDTQPNTLADHIWRITKYNDLYMILYNYVNSEIIEIKSECVDITWVAPTWVEGFARAVGREASGRCKCLATLRPPNSTDRPSRCQWCHCACSSRSLHTPENIMFALHDLKIVV